jgi:hypothetical protein
MIRTLFHDPAAREDLGVDAVVNELLANSNDFAELWKEHGVSSLGSKSKTFNHPDVGGSR